MNIKISKDTKKYILVVPQFYDLNQLNELVKQGRKNKRKDS